VEQVTEKSLKFKLFVAGEGYYSFADEGLM
jgi:hypothetical protein